MSKNKWYFDLTMEATKKFNKTSPIKVYTKEELEEINGRLRNGEELSEAIETTSEVP